MAIVSYGISGDVTGTGYADMAATASYTLSNASTKIVLPTVKLRAVSSGITNARYHTLAMAQLYANGNTKYISTTRSASTSVGEYSSAVNWVETSTQTSAGVNVNTANYFTSSNKTAKTVTGYVRVVANNTEYYLTRADGDIILVAPNSTKNLCTVTFTLNAPPTFTSTQVSFDTSEVYSGLTTASITTSNLVAQYGGEISSVKFTIGNQNVTSSSAGTMSILLAQEGTFTPTVTVTDSRGQATTKSLNPITVNGYTIPSVNFNIERTDSNGVRADEGTYAVASTNITFTDAIATLLAPTIKVNGTTVTPTWYATRTSDGTLSGSVNWNELTSPTTVYALINGNFSTQTSYQIGVTPIDDKGTGTEIIQTLPSAFYTIDFLAGGHGIAFGEPASTVGFSCNMDATFKQSVTVKDNNNVLRSLIDLFYPVGSYYETSDENFNPNVTWGGTWEPELQGQVHVSAGTNYPVTTTNTSAGGSKDAVVVAHTHQPLTANYFLNTYNMHAAGDMGAMSGSGRHYVYQATASSGSYWASNATTKSAGVSGTNANMMPYRVVYRWWRTA